MFIKLIIFAHKYIPDVMSGNSWFAESWWMSANYSRITIYQSTSIQATAEAMFGSNSWVLKL